MKALSSACVEPDEPADGGPERERQLALNERVRNRLAEVRERISAAGGDPKRVSIVAVTKTFGLPEVYAAIACGIVLVGENRTDELIDKSMASPAAERPQWQFLGPVQTNKINRLVEHVSCWQSIDSMHRAQALGKRAPGATVLLQMRLEAGGARGGAGPAEVEDLLRVATDSGLSVSGLMGVGPRDPSESLQAFRTLVAVADRLSLPIRSIGMSDDLESAVMAGSTMVRVGSSLFGPRV